MSKVASTKGEMWTAQPHLEAGFIAVSPNAKFRTHKDALNCFGYQKGHFQHAAWRIPDEVCDALNLPYYSMVWFPALTESEEWDNKLLENDALIIETKKDSSEPRKDKWAYRVVMAKRLDEKKRPFYQFLGVFAPIPEYRQSHEHRFRKVSDRINTFAV